VLEELLSYTSPSVLSLFKLGNPVVYRGIEFGEGFFLLEYRFVGETSDAGRA
jgi:hypothetical protein